MFNIGDRVKCTEAHDDNVYIIGEEGLIVGWEAEAGYLVVFDDYINGHDGWHKGESKGEYGYCWWVLDDKLELIDFTLENE